MRIDLREVRFEDGTAWELGNLYRIDPADPRKWTALGERRPGEGERPPDLKPGERLIEDHSGRAARGADTGALAVTEISVGGQSVTPGRPFVAGADWRRGLTLRVKNISSKPIVFVQISFSMPEARYRAGGLGFSFRYGDSRPEGEGRPADAKTLPPGEEAVLGFADDEYEANRKFVEQLSGLTEITRVRMGTAHVTFADGTKAFVAIKLSAAKSATPGGEK